MNSEAYGDFKTSWCPGCGNHDVMKALKKTLASLNLPPHRVAHISGIGQAAKAPHYINLNGFNGLHGRCLPPAQAVKLSNHELTVIAESGDGCNYGEGGNHFLAAIRRNVDMTLLVHNNQIYGLTKGQASPTTMSGHITKSQPNGVFNTAFNPVAVAVAMRCGFVARGFSGDIDQLSDLMAQAIQHRGFALIDIFSPCISFNKINTFGWYKQRCKTLDASYDPTDWDNAMRTAMEFGDRIPLGVLYREDKPALEDHLPILRGGPLCRQPVDKQTLRDIMAEYC